MTLDRLRYLRRLLPEYDHDKKSWPDPTYPNVLMYARGETVRWLQLSNPQIPRTIMLKLGLISYTSDLVKPQTIGQVNY